jgi:hypothetical protein
VREPGADEHFTLNRSTREKTMMLDIIFIAATALFFALGIFYVRGCERLK